MKILVITNYYPPSQYGWGYMHICEEVVEGLHILGHQISVLTSIYGKGKTESHTYPVYRLLDLDPDWKSNHTAAYQFFFERRKKEKKAIDYLREIIKDFKPESIFIWSGASLPRVLFQLAENSGIPVVYYLAGYLPELPDEYIAYWESSPKTKKALLLKKYFSSIALRKLNLEGKPIHLGFKNVICVSHFVRERLIQKNLISSEAIVIHNGVNLDKFNSNGIQSRIFLKYPFKCVLAGRIVPDKGILTAIRSFKFLQQKGKVNNFRLTIFGDGPVEYMISLHKEIEQNNLQEFIQIFPPVERNMMPNLLSKYDLLLLPSEYDEPLACSMLEGMAMGLLVIGTITGGSGELLIHQETGLVHETAEPGDLAEKLLWVIENPDQASQIAQGGYQMVRDSFTIEKTVENVERYLQSVIDNNKML